ncbi:hypothetical protein IM538_06650 [Cytobacillus suaedae]|nr:hypothetical protein IM538_06650 [Cytobacillus suaedae]
MLLYALLTGLAIVIELLLGFFLSWVLDMQYHDVLFLFGAFMSAIIWFSSNRGKNAETGLSFDMYNGLGEMLNMKFIPEEKYSALVNPFFIGSLLVMGIGIVLSLIIYV